MNYPILRIDLRFVNVYLLRAGDGYVLIDTGIVDVWTQLENELLKLGVLPEKLKLVILTHGDKDHAGNGNNLQQKYGVKIAMHKEDLEMVQTGKSPRRHGRNLAGRLIIWFDSKVSSDYIGFEPGLFLQDDQTLEPYGLSARIIHTPGHTRGSICVLTDAGELIVGDTFTNRKKPQSAHIIENDQELKKSQSKLAATQACMVYPGHGRPFTFEELLKITSS